MKASGWKVEKVKDINMGTIPEIDSRLKLYYGKGALKRLPFLIGLMKDEIGDKFDLDLKRALFLCSDNENPAYEVIRSVFKEEKVELTEYCGIRANPSYEQVESAVDTFRKFNGQVLIAAGGGSVIDASKIIAYRLFGEGEKHRVKPLITIPTTSGAGSELNSWAVITDSETGCKESSQWALPFMAVIDPISFLSLPPRQTFISGLDTFIQGMEGYVSINSNKASRKGSKEGAIRASRALKGVLLNPDDPDLRLEMALASASAGVSMSFAGLGIPHGIANQISSVPHGLIVAAVFPQATAYSIRNCSRQYLGRYAGIIKAVFPDLDLDNFLDENGKIPDSKRNAFADKVSVRISEWIWKDLEGVNYVDKSEIVQFHRLLNGFSEYKKHSKYHNIVEAALANVNTKSDPVFAKTVRDVDPDEPISQKIYQKDDIKEKSIKRRFKEDDVVDIAVKGIKGSLSYIPAEKITEGTSITGKTLYINLNQKTHEVKSWIETFRMEYGVEPGLREMLGGFSRGVVYFLDTNPESFSDRIVFSTGFLTGDAKHKMMLSANRIFLVFRSPLKEKKGKYGICWSSVGSDTGIELKKLGVDDIVIDGSTETPVLMFVKGSNGNIDVDFEKADPLLMTTETRDLFKKKHGYDFAAMTGPAANNGVRFASVHFAVPGKDELRAAARGGCGLVLASKKIKGIGIKGKESRFPTPEVTQAKEVKQVNKEVATSLETSWVDQGTMGATLDMLLPIDALPAYNFSTFIGKDDENVFNIWKAKLEQKGWAFVKDGCGACALKCEKSSVTPDNQRLPKVEYESLNYLGPNLGVFDLRTITRANYLCDRLGMDTLSTGACIGMLLEYNKKTGKSPTFGLDSDTLLNLINEIACRKGVGAVLADGLKKASEKIGCPELAVHFKGLPYAAYSPANLGAAFAIRGDHVGSRTYFWWLQLEDPNSVDEWVGHIVEGFSQAMILQSVGGCWFTGSILLKHMPMLVREMLGWDVDKAGILDSGFKTYLLARFIDNKSGFSMEDDVMPHRAYDKCALPLSVRDGVEFNPEFMTKLAACFYSEAGMNEDGIVTSDALYRPVS